MAFYLANDDDLASVANALRAKTGLSKQLVFPDEFVSTINSITGDGIEISIDSIPTENSNNAVSSGGVYSALAAKQNDLTQVPITEFIYSTDYLFVERNGTIYKVLVSALSNDSPESDPNALNTDDGDSILTESGDELVIDTEGETDNAEALSLEDGRQLSTEDNKQLLMDMI